MNANELFELIVATLLSTKPVRPEIIRQHVQAYATISGIPYSLARQAVILGAKDRLQKKIESIG